MEIVAVRHLATNWNRRGWLQGRQDIPIIDPRGNTGGSLQESIDSVRRYGPYDQVVTSRLSRTRQTASYFGYDEFKADALLDELDFGPYEGRPKQELLTNLGDDWIYAPAAVTLGEPVAALEARVHKFLETYSSRSRILIFGHGAWLRCLRSVIAHGDCRTMNRANIENNEVLRLEFFPE